MSGRRRMRSASTRPISAAPIGTRRAICNAMGRASVLMSMISAWTAGGWPASDLRELGVAHQLGVVLQRVGDLLLLSRREHVAVVGHVG